MKQLVVLALAISLVGCANKPPQLDNDSLTQEGKVPVVVESGRVSDRYPVERPETEVTDFSRLLPPTFQAETANSQAFNESGVVRDGNKVTLVRVDRPLTDVWQALNRELSNHELRIVEADGDNTEIVVTKADWVATEEEAFLFQSTPEITIDLVLVAGATQISFWNAKDQAADEAKVKELIAIISKILELNLEP